MRNQRLTGVGCASADEVVGWLGAVQSQDYGPAQWSVAQRTSNLTEFDLEQAVNVGAILRTHVLRPTWHFVRPADIRWMLELTRPRVHAMSAHGERREALDAAVFKQAFAALARGLEGGRHLTRTEITACLQQAGVVAQAGRLGHILMRAELEGLICSGSRKGKQHTYALLDERVPPTRARTRDEALAELTLRYFTSHGPATVADFRWWSSLTAADIAQGLELAGPCLASETIDGRTYRFASPVPVGVDGGPPTAHLLQPYDEYIVGYSESRYAALDVSGAARSNEVVFTAVVVVDGQVAGWWRRTAGKGSVAVEVALFEPPDEPVRAALTAAAERYGAFVGLPVTLAIR